MFSYLACIKPLVNDSVYASGIKLYLEGKVIDTKDMSLPHWKTCKVHGNNESLHVTFPEIHNLIPTQSEQIQTNALKHHAQCTCPYFVEYGTCKHIVAICCQYDDTLGKKIQKQPSKTEAVRIDSTMNSLIDTMFAVEGQKTSRKWINQIDQYMTRLNSEDCFWFDEIVRNVAGNPSDYTGFIVDFQSYIDTHIQTFEYEAKIVELIKHSLYFGEKLWWDFWLPILPKLSQEAQLKIWVSSWKLYLAGVFNMWKQDFLYQLRENDLEFNHTILEKLQHDFRDKSEFWTRFVIEAQITGWIEENFEKLDPLNLLKIVQHVSDKQESIEEAIYKHIRVWSDFLTTGSYDQIIEVFQAWKDTLGQTDIYQDAQNYIKLHHPKKKSLLGKIGL